MNHIINGESIMQSIIQNILAMRREGYCNAAILEYVTSEDVEFPDASALVTRVLKLTYDEQMDMEDCYQ
jgi:hypothetical protein